ncbi:MAG: nucleoside recognition domain-containing protein [Marinagarivorans sp.]|nr:nucleoside recognition domain-containing protein [Marinagarivorans sp.]
MDSLCKQLFRSADGVNIAEMPAYHRPLIRNVLTQTWHRLYSFTWRAGKSIVMVVLVLNVVNSLGTDGSWGNQDTEKSALSATGKVLTPLFVPMGVGEENWPATVGLFTGLFAKEVVVGTLDTLYTQGEAEDDTSTFADKIIEGFTSIADNASGLLGALVDPLGIASAQEDAAAEEHTSYAAMLSLFPSAWGAFCYLAFILLYAPCVATIGAMQRESGKSWLIFSMVWSLLLSYWLATNLWHLSFLLSDPVKALVWIAASTGVMIGCYLFIMHKMRQGLKDLIPAVNL